MTDVVKKIEKSVKIYPLYTGMSTDLIFWAAISTLFLVNVKKFNAAQINSLEAISLLVCLVGYFGILKFIKTIGNLKTIKIGNLLLLISAIIITFFKSYYGVLLGFILYKYAFLFKSVDFVILKNNLKYLKQENKFFLYQTRGTLIYSIITLFIALISGYIFNINNYLPMYISIFFCILTCILVNFIKEVDVKKEKNEEVTNKANLTKSLIILLLFSFIMYGLLISGQLNSKLIIQNDMTSFLNAKELVYYFSIIIFISRVFRVLSNILFTKIYNKIKKYMLFIINGSFILSFSLILIGNYIKGEYMGISIMAIGFIIILSIRDALENYCRTIVLDNCSFNERDKVATYYYLARVIGTFLFSSIISLILLKFDLRFVIFYLFITSLLVALITIKSFKIVNS